MKLFVDELKDIYWAEKALVKAIPKMIKNATSEDLIHALKAILKKPKTKLADWKMSSKPLVKKHLAKNAMRWRA